MELLLEPCQQISGGWEPCRQRPSSARVEAGTGSGTRICRVVVVDCSLHLRRNRRCCSRSASSAKRHPAAAVGSAGTSHSNFGA